jgi:two-component system copper resistance phosphate regulon response regulator CusR
MKIALYSSNNLMFSVIKDVLKDFKAVYSCYESYDFNACFDLKNLFDLVIIDYGKEKNYINLAKFKDLKIRSAIFVICEFSLMNKIKALNFGADDVFSNKFLEPRVQQEFIARLKSLLRRANNSYDSCIFFDNVAVNLALKKVEIANKTIPLTDMEYKLVEFMVIRMNTVIAREQILMHLYPDVDEYIDINCVDNYFKKISHKFKLRTNKKYIERIRNCFKFVVENPKYELQNRKDLSC